MKRHTGQHDGFPLTLTLSLILVGTATAQVAEVRRPPLITGYQHQGCLEPGAQLVIDGIGFGEHRGENRVVFWDAAQPIELIPVLWRDTQVTVRVPSDRRVQPGRSYQVRVEDRRGRLLGNLGPQLTICTATPAVDPGAARARQLAQAVFQANGGARWREVTSIRFTFNVAQDGKPLLAATHDWDVRAGTATVAWGGKRVTVNLRKPGADADSQAAHARWVNDTYWLLAPLKLLDAGVKLSHVGTRVVAGQQYEVIRTSYQQVGLTPGDQYNFYIDPTTSRVAFWDYRPDTPQSVTGTWEKYEQFGPLLLSTDHQFGNKRIWFTDIAVK